MRDGLKYMRMDGIEKRLHGHAKLELFDAKTKDLIQKVEKDNLVTTALSRAINNIVGAVPGNLGDLIMPIATRGLGGIMLFDGVLEEDEDNYAFPMNVSLVGYGNRGVNTSNTKAGSLNNSESGPISGGYRSVWDFGTSQANGNIYSVALSNQFRSPFYGFADYDIHQIVNSSGNTWSTFPFYFDGEYVYMAEGSGSYTSSWDSQTRTYTYYNNFSVSIYKERIPLTNYKVGDVVNHRDYPPELVTSRSYSVTTVGDVLYNYNVPQYNAINGYDGYVYFIFTVGNASGNGTVFWFRMKYSDLSFDASDLATISLTNAFLRRGPGVASGGYFYFLSYDLRSVYKVQISNTANISQIVLPEGYYFAFTDRQVIGAIIPHPSGGLMITVYTTAANSQAGYYDHYPGFINAQDVITLDGAYSVRDQQTYYGTDQMRMWNYDFMHSYQARWRYDSYYGYAGRMITNYLGTICNLSSPIAKNASQTLKITYELYDDEG